VVETPSSIGMKFASFDDCWAPCVGKEGFQAESVATLGDVERFRLRDAVRLASVDGEADGPRSFAALAWAVKGIAPGWLRNDSDRSVGRGEARCRGGMAFARPRIASADRPRLTQRMPEAGTLA
jgi:hypothetical protein